MRTYRPSWNPKNVMLVGVSLFFWLLFLAATLLIGWIAVTSFAKSPSLESLVFLALPIAMSVGLGFWTFGLTDMLTKRFDLVVSDDIIHFRYSGGPMDRDFQIAAITIENVSICGNPQIGVWVEVDTPVKTHRFGHLLSWTDAQDIADRINEEKNKS